MSVEFPLAHRLVIAAGAAVALSQSFADGRTARRDAIYESAMLAGDLGGIAALEAPTDRADDLLVAAELLLLAIRRWAAADPAADGSHEVIKHWRNAALSLADLVRAVSLRDAARRAA
jgi:hypothetical protein